MLVKNFVWRPEFGTFIQDMVAVMADYTLRHSFPLVIEENKHPRHI